MKFTLENGTLTFYLEGELNSFVKEKVEKEIEEIMSKNTFNKIVLDLQNLSYISSAGLRIIVRIKQECDETILVNTPNSIYDIFHIVGFEKIIKIERL